MEIKIKDHLLLYTNKKRKHCLIDLGILFFNRFIDDDNKNIMIYKIGFFKWLWQVYSNNKKGWIRFYMPKFTGA